MDEQNNAPEETSDEEPTWEPAEPVAAGTPTQAPPAVAAPKPRFRDRVYGVRSLAAVAAAGLVLGSAGAVGVSAIAGHDDDGHRDGDRGHFPHLSEGGIRG